MPLLKAGRPAFTIDGSYHGEFSWSRSNSGPSRLSGHLRSSKITWIDRLFIASLLAFHNTEGPISHVFQIKDDFCWKRQFFLLQYLMPSLNRLWCLWNIVKKKPQCYDPARGCKAFNINTIVSVQYQHWLDRPQAYGNTNISIVASESWSHKTWF